MSEAVVTVMGRLTADPTWGHTKNRDVFANFDIAVNHGYYDRERQQYIETGSSYFSVSTFRNLAINAVESLKKGMPVIVQGRLRLVKWDSGERHGTTARIEASALGPDLSFGQAEFTKVSRPALVADDPMEDPAVTGALSESSSAPEESAPDSLADLPPEPAEDDYQEEDEGVPAALSA